MCVTPINVLQIPITPGKASPTLGGQMDKALLSFSSASQLAEAGQLEDL